MLKVCASGFVRVHAPLKERPLTVKLFEKLSRFLASHMFAKLYVRLLHKVTEMGELEKIFARAFC